MIIQPKRKQFAVDEYYETQHIADSAVDNAVYPSNISKYSNTMVIYFNSLSTFWDSGTAQNAGQIGNNENYYYWTGEDLGAIPSKNKAFKASLDKKRLDTALGGLKVNAGDADWKLKAKETLGAVVNTQYKRTSNAIHILIPHSIQVGYGANWEEVTANPNALGLLATELMNGEADLGESMGNVAAILARESGENIVDLAVQGEIGEALTGKTLNPYTQQAFKGMTRRSFQFTWQFVPSNADELQSIDTIISLLKFHAHPSIDFASGSGGVNNYLEYPGNIDVEWYTSDGNGGLTENPWLPKITTCVIESISTNYTPNGQFAAFNNSGAPVQIDLTITVKEIHTLMKQDIARGA